MILQQKKDNCNNHIESNIIQFPSPVTKNKNIKRNYKKNEEQTVYPFKTKEDIEAIGNYFLQKNQQRNLLLFILGINIGLRASDLLSLTWDKLLDSNGEVTTEPVTIVEKKTNKKRTFILNAACQKALRTYIDSKRLKDFSSFCFLSNKGGTLEVRSYCKILKMASRELGFKYNVGTHSMRKTFAYHQIIAHRNDALFLTQLQKLLNHSSPAITLRYAGITAEEEAQLYNDVNLYC